MTSGVVPHYQPCLLVRCLTIGHAFCGCLTTGNAFWCGALLSAMPAGVLPHCMFVAFWCGASLSTMPIGVLPHYRPCLLVWCLIINYACWCGSSLQPMPVGVVLHFRPCFLVYCHCNQCFTSRVQMEEWWS